jgi:hypothetical protein
LKPSFKKPPIETFFLFAWRGVGGDFCEASSVQNVIRLVYIGAGSTLNQGSSSDFGTLIFLAFGPSPLFRSELSSFLSTCHYPTFIVVKKPAQDGSDLIKIKSVAKQTS